MTAALFSILGAKVPDDVFALVETRFGQLLALVITTIVMNVAGIVVHLIYKRWRFNLMEAKLDASIKRADRLLAIVESHALLTDTATGQAKQTLRKVETAAAVDHVKVDEIHKRVISIDEKIPDNGSGVIVLPKG